MLHPPTWILRLGALALGGALTAVVLAPAAEPPLAALDRPNGEPAVPSGVEVLARGPVHEAFAGPLNSKPQAGELVNRQPPEPIEELPPDQKPEGDEVEWIPGYWSWDDDREDFIWISGFWRVPPPNRRWVPGTWNQVGAGWQWTGGFWAPDTQEELIYQPPPPEPIDNGPSTPAPSADHVYTPGSWVYADTRYVWRPGCWVPCRPGWVWMPAHYVWTPCGYVFVEGYWDYPLADRGVLFAPVYIDRVVYTRPAFCYTPCYVVQDDFLFGAMWVRPGCGSYYFGDYFEARYTSRGFTSWCDVRIGVGCYDPLFSYYSWSYGPSSGWAVGLRGLYVGRFNGTYARPPRTLVQQNTVVNNVVINKNVNVVNVHNHVNKVQNVNALAPLGQVDRNKVKLQPVAADRLARERESARRIQEASRQRAAVEKDLVVRAQGPDRPDGGLRTAKLDLPKPPPTRSVNPARTPPPPPVKPVAARVGPAGAPDAKPPLPGGAKPPIPGGAKPQPGKPPVAGDGPKPQPGKPPVPGAGPGKSATPGDGPKPPVAGDGPKPQPGKPAVPGAGPGKPPTPGDGPKPPVAGDGPKAQPGKPPVPGAGPGKPPLPGQGPKPPMPGAGPGKPPVPGAGPGKPPMPGGPGPQPVRPPVTAPGAGPGGFRPPGAVSPNPGAKPNFVPPQGGPRPPLTPAANLRPPQGAPGRPVTRPRPAPQGPTPPQPAPMKR